jgi:hypothetical protein
MAQLCVPLTGGHAENFNSLSSTGSSNTSVPFGFAFVESGASGNLTYAADNGSSTSGNTYSYGATGDTDRALGELTSATVQTTIGACFVNSTGQALSSVSIGYTGEEWRLGTADGTVDKLDFQVSTDALSLTVGNWTNINELDFTTPNNAVAGIKDGNAAANRTVFSPFTINLPNPVQPTNTFYVRWVPVLVAGTNTNDGLAIDEFSIAIPEPSTGVLAIAAVCFIFPTLRCSRARAV